jgi:hypothetical protein
MCLCIYFCLSPLLASSMWVEAWLIAEFSDK